MTERKEIWRLSELAQATRGLLNTERDCGICGFSIDTRTIEPGDVFVALRGNQHDGHKFVQDAHLKGAAAAIVSSEAPFGTETGLPMLVVQRPLDALERIARAARKRCVGAIIGITGSVGKTSTRSALSHILSKTGTVVASRKSYNNHIGVPISVSNLTADTEFGIFEIGTNHPGEILPLTRIVHPHIAIVTAIAPSHIGHFGSELRIAEEKSSIMEGMEKDGAVIIPRDSIYFNIMQEKAITLGVDRVISFGMDRDSDSYIDNIYRSRPNWLVTVNVLGIKTTFSLPLPGDHHAINALVALTVAKLLGTDMEIATESLCNFTIPSGRGQRKTIEWNAISFVLYDDSYNASPKSMASSFSTFSTMENQQKGRRIAVIGDMLELGDFSKSYHEELYSHIDKAGISRVFLCGNEVQALWDILPKELRGAISEYPEQLIEPLLDELSNGDSVIVKGSQGSGVHRIAKHLSGLRDDTARPENE